MLSEERIQLLDIVGIVWDTEAQEWQENFHKLKQYVDSNGSALVPAKYPIIGVWVSHLRQKRKKGELSGEKIRLLDSVGFVWDPLEQQWQEKFYELKQYIADNGNALVIQSHPVLGRWVQRQRRDKKNGTLSDERIQLLEEIGFIWKVC